MSCRVGMATNPDERIRRWMKKEGYKYSEILAFGLTYEEATIFEQVEAEARGCEQSPGGEYVGGAVWSVYHVWGAD